LLKTAAVSFQNLSFLGGSACSQQNQSIYVIVFSSFTRATRGERKALQQAAFAPIFARMCATFCQPVNLRQHMHLHYYGRHIHIAGQHIGADR
jgi:hypothetical protein